MTMNHWYQSMYQMFELVSDFIGSMYSNEKTPDGYQVGADGALQ